MRCEVGGVRCEGHVTRQHKNSSQQRLDQRVVQHGEYAEAVHVTEEESGSYNRNGKNVHFGAGDAA